MTHRLAGHPESIISFILVALAFIGAYFLSQPKWRNYGARLASVMLVLLGLILLIESLLGYQARPAVIPFIDDFKPWLLLLQGGVALVCGVWLFKQKLAPGSESLQAKNQAQGYGAWSRYLHWSTAIIFLVLIPMGIFMTMIPKDAWYRDAYYVIHKTLGFTLFALVLIRIGWNFLNISPDHSTSLKPWEKRAAQIAHRVLYFILLALPLSGYFMSSFADRPMELLIWNIPSPLTPDDDLKRLFGFLHKILLPYLCYLVLGLHIIGALKHQLVDKHKHALKRMVG